MPSTQQQLADKIIERVKEAAKRALGGAIFGAALDMCGGMGMGSAAAAANFVNECREAHALFEELKGMADDFNAAKKIVKSRNKARGNACNGLAMDKFLDSL